MSSSGSTTASTDGVRRQNTALVLRTLRQGGPASRAGLAKRTELSKATIGVIVGDLDALGALADAADVDQDESRPTGRGRPGRPVSLRSGTHLGLGLELNVDYAALALVDLAGDVVASETLPVEQGRALERAAVVELARSVLERFPAERHTLVGATIAVPGLVRGDNRTVAWAPNLGLDGAEPRSWLEDALGGRCPVLVDNDANCAASAEAHHGAATDVDDFLYLTGTVGIGAGILQGGRMLRGSSGFAGEVGHMPIGDPDAVCGCGRRGCWEASIGLLAMLERVGMPELATPVLTAESVAARAAYDPVVATALGELGRDVGLGLATLATVLDPTVMVLGGYFVPLGEHVLATARTVLDQRLPSRAQRRPELRLSTLGIQAAATGAAEQSLQGVFTGEVDLA